MELIFLKSLTHKLGIDLSYFPTLETDCNKWWNSFGVVPDVFFPKNPTGRSSCPRSRGSRVLANGLANGRWKFWTSGLYFFAPTLAFVIVEKSSARLKKSCQFFFITCLTPTLLKSNPNKNMSTFLHSIFSQIKNRIVFGSFHSHSICSQETFELHVYAF